MWEGIGAIAHYAADNEGHSIAVNQVVPVLYPKLRAKYGNEVAFSDLTIGSYRRAASVIIPKMTQVAWETKKDEIEKLTPGMTHEKFIYNLTRAGYEKEWGKQYDKPDFEDKLMAFFFSIIPPKHKPDRKVTQKKIAA
jgi:hypothetical protein